MQGFLAVMALLLALAAPARAQNRLWLANESQQPIVSIYVSPSRLDNWGADALGDALLPPGQQVHLTPQAEDCLLDLRVRYLDGQEETRPRINVCRLNRVSFQGGAAGARLPEGVRSGDPSFRFINRTPERITELYVAFSTSGKWGQDLLGESVLEPGADRWVELPVGRLCRVDVRVVYGNGQAQEKRLLDTCSRNDMAWR